MTEFQELDIAALTEDRQKTHFETGKSIILYRGQVGTIVGEASRRELFNY
ncbi:hypothetical protein [Okeania sp. SIO2C9]|nr:hypothetical protein [Okeania sp. SIO2C9]